MEAFGNQFSASGGIPLHPLQEIAQKYFGLDLLRGSYVKWPTIFFCLDSLRIPNRVWHVFVACSY